MSWHRRYERAETIRTWLADNLAEPNYTAIEKEVEDEIVAAADDFADQAEEKIESEEIETILDFFEKAMALFVRPEHLGGAFSEENKDRMRSWLTPLLPSARTLLVEFAAGHDVELSEIDQTPEATDLLSLVDELFPEEQPGHEERAPAFDFGG